MTENKQPNLYQKIQSIKDELMQMNLKKTWENEYAHFKYYELGDILPAIVDLCLKYKLFTHITFKNEEATLTIVNIDNPEESVEYLSPMRDLELKWCNQIQALWGVETYQRRYLYMNAFDIVEQDMFDATSWKENKWSNAWAVQKETSNADTSASDEKPRFNKENLDKFTTIAKQYKNADEALKEIRSYYKVSKDNEWKIRRLYEDLELINS